MFFWQNSCRQAADFFNNGGPVMVPLLIVSIIMWLLIFNRIFFFRRLLRQDLDSRGALECIKTDRPPEIQPHGGAVSILVTNFLSHRSRNQMLDRFILDENVARLKHRLEGHLPLIGVLATVAPLLGLLGTVTGMIATFDVMAIFGTGNARGMACGISEALITTQTGLIVAIPGLYMHGYLSRRAHEIKQRVQRVGLHLRQHL